MVSEPGSKPFGSGSPDRSSATVDVITPDAVDDGASTPARDQIGRIGRFVIISELGRGGMGTVYAAYDPDLDRRVAIKVVNDPEGKGQDRLLREAQALAQLSHPNVVPVFEAGRHDGEVFLAMEYVEGHTLKAWLAAHRPGWREIVRVFREAGKGLHAAHRAGLVHRDFKPDNVMFGDDGRVRVMDFGLVRGTTSGSGPVATATDGDEDGEELVEATTPPPQFLDQLTVAGRVMGTPRYMAAEQFMGTTVDARTDLYAFCVALYEALLGEPPYRSDSVKKLAMDVIEGRRAPRPKVSRKRCPPWLLAVIERGLAPTPASRWPDMPTLLDALGYDPDQRRRRLVAGIGLPVLALGAFGLGVWRQPATSPTADCQAGRARIGAVWNDDQAGKIRGAFDDQPAFADQALALALTHLDDYAVMLGQSAASSCRAYHVDKTMSDQAFDRSQACVERGLAALRTVAGELQRGDIEVLERLDEVLVLLPDQEACRTTESSTQTPLAPATAEIVSKMRADLVAIEAGVAAGRIADAAPGLDDLDARARVLGAPGLLAEIALARTRLLPENGAEASRWADAVAAMRLAGTANMPALEARAALALARHDRGASATDAAQRGRAWIDVARARAPEPEGDESEFTLELEHIRAVVEEQAADYDAALAAATARTQLAHALYPAPDVRIGRAHADAARLRMIRGEYELAVAEVEKAREQYAATVGPDHPLMATIQERLGNAASVQGRSEEAVAFFQRAQEIQTAAYGAEDSRALKMLPSLAIEYDNMGRPRDALHLLETYLEGRGETDGARTIDGIQALNSVCFIRYRLDELDAAERACQAALAEIDHVYPDPHYFRSGIANNLALIARARGDVELALTLDADALEGCEATLGPQHSFCAYAHVGLGESHLLTGARADARSSFERALQIRRGEGTPPAELAEARCLLAETLPAEELGRAVKLATRGAHVLGGGGQMWAKAAARCQGWLDRHAGG